MESQQRLKELEEELGKQRADVSKLRNALNELDREKEGWFRKKEEFSAKIRASIQKIKDSKAKRDILTNEVKELKPKRDSINKETVEKIKEFEKLKKEKTSLIKSLNVKESPSRIKQNIERLEFKIETEPMAYNKEQSLMKKIKELKKLYDNSEEVRQSTKEINAISDEIRKMNKEANDAHKSIQEKARQSQSSHEEILKTSKEIDEIKVNEEEAFKKFSELKKKFNEANSQLKEKLKAMNGTKALLDKILSDKKEKRRMEQESFLKSKEEEVNRKIQRKEKLTTEDLLIFQQSKDNK